MEVRARAPGKIILAGEHAVVHGSTAVAAAIDRYTYVSLRFPSPSDIDETLILHLKDLDVEFSWPIGKITEAFPKQEVSKDSPPSSCSLVTLKAIALLVDEKNIPEAKYSLASGVSAFLFLYTSIHGCKPAKAVVTAELPLGSGLGSSASFCVALSGALLSLSDSLNMDFSHQGWQKFGETDLELVNKWALEGEKMIHCKPSGIDNTVSTFGNMIKFKSGDLTCIKSNIPLKMLITNTKVGRNTKALVAGVSERAMTHPDAMSSVFTAVDCISNEVSSIIQTSVSDDIETKNMEEKLAELMEMNHGLLQCMGVSHSSIETVLRTTKKYKLRSKLTGGGGGGCVLTLLPTLLSGKVVDEVISELESSGFQCLIVGIGGGGMEVSFCGSSQSAGEATQ